MPADEKQIIGFQAPISWFERLRAIGAPSGTKVSQLVRLAVYEKYIAGNLDNGHSQATTENEKSDRKSA